MGLFGGGGGGTMLKPLDEAMFKPYTYTSMIGTTAGRRTADGGFEFSTDLSQGLKDLYGTAETQANPFLAGALAAMQDPVRQFGYQGMDTAQRERDIFQQQQDLLMPAFQQQNIAAREGMFGSGRLGLQLSGEAVGAGSGMVNPDAYNVNLAQSRALAELAPQARQMAQAEEQAAFERAQQRYLLESAADQQRIQNLLGGYQTAFGGLSDIYGLESQLLGQSAGLEEARSAAAARAAQAAANLYQPSSGGGGFGGSFGGALGGALGKVAGAYVKGKVMGGGAGTGAGTGGIV